MNDARPLHIGVAAVLTLTAVGFFSGVAENARESTDAGHAKAAPSSTVHAASSARSYADARTKKYGPNAHVYDDAFEALGKAHPSVLDPVVQTSEEREATLAKRKARRAYDGAPPTIPHTITQIGPPDCVGCHESGAKIGDSIAPKMSHAPYSSCTQCHVVMNDPRPLADAPPPPQNGFAGLESWGEGTRAWPGAPPTIPHPTAMRSDCSSCHGVFGAQGIKSTHPWRQSCTQCHVADAKLDQRPAASLGPGGAVP